ncbi:MAG TPA: hypothetical protein VHO67_07770 [Polyangia bacterium]|nr:hypothetical protein [Polyangia bacterium]
MRRSDDGVWLVLGAAGIFLAWLLMPDAATNDAAHILAAVGAGPARVRASALIQLAASALLVPGVLGLARDGESSRLGVAMLMWGVLGMAADAVFHQLAGQLTAPGVDAATALAVMRKMQTVELVPHVPLLLAFVVAGPVLGWTPLRRTTATWGPRLLVAPVPTVPLAVLSVRLLGLPRRIAALTVLGEVCGGLVLMGGQRARRQWRSHQSVPSRSGSLHRSPPPT